MMRRLLVLALALVVTACGGSTDVRRPKTGMCLPIPDFATEFGVDDGGKPPDCNALDGYELYLLNDFEGAHDPSWYFNNDRTALMSPAPDSQGTTTTPIPGGRCVGAAPTALAATVCTSPETPAGGCTESYALGSWSAMEIKSGTMSGNGGVFGTILPKDGCIVPPPDDPATPEREDLDPAVFCPLKPGPPEVGPCSTGEGPSPAQLGCHAHDDFGGWEGVAFWGRVGPGSDSSIRLRASDSFTDDKACNCNPYTSQNDASDGCDKFGEFVELDGNFRVVFVRFDEMQQGGWGLPRPSLDTHDIFELGFEYGAGAWDLWIDDVALFRRRP